MPGCDAIKPSEEIEKTGTGGISCSRNDDTASLLVKAMSDNDKKEDLKNKKRSINWDEVKDRTPLPHFIKDNSVVVVETDNNENIQISGTCLFPKEDPTLATRKQVNHFHSIILMDTVFALNVIWNSARVVAQVMNWENMISAETNTRVFHPIEIDKEYDFCIFVEPMKGNFKKARLEILGKYKEEKTKLISVETKVNVS